VAKDSNTGCKLHRPSVAGQQLALVLVPLQRAHLAVSVDGVEHDAGVGVPELDAAVRGAAAGRQQVRLERAPRQRLHGGLVRVEAVEVGLVADGAGIPDVRDWRIMLATLKAAV